VAIPMMPGPEVGLQPVMEEAREETRAH